MQNEPAAPHPLRGTPSLLRAINDRTALELLLEHGPMSRADIGALTGDPVGLSRDTRGRVPRTDHGCLHDLSRGRSFPLPRSRPQNRVVVSMQPQPWPEVPADTVRVARKAFRKGTLAMRARDELGGWCEDEAFAAAYGVRGKPGISPAQLAMVTALQFTENLTDRQAADAVRGRLDWKYCLGLALEDEGFDFSVLSEFCPVRDRCTRSTRTGRQLSLRPREVHQAVAAARAGQTSQQWKNRYNIRAGVEGTMRQATHRHPPRPLPRPAQDPTRTQRRRCRNKPDPAGRLVDRQTPRPHPDHPPPATRPDPRRLNRIGQQGLITVPAARGSPDHGPMTQPAPGTQPPALVIHRPVVPEGHGWSPGQLGRAGLVPMTTVALSSSELATCGISPARETVSTVCGAWRRPVSTSTWPPGASQSGAAAATRRRTSSPSAPPSSATRGSCTRASGGSSPIAWVGT